MKKEKSNLDKVIEELIESENMITIEDVDNYYNKLKERTIQSMLEGEMNHHLGYKSNDKDEKTTTNRRNGHSSKGKKVKTNFGEIEVNMPRDRDGSFNPLIIGKRQRVLNNMDDSIILMYAKGMTQRDITDIVKATYKVSVSPQFISNVVQQVCEDVEKWQKRPLKKFYTFMYVDCLYAPIKENILSEKRPIYVIIGVDITGHKEVVGVWIGDSEGEGSYFWCRIFEELKGRGVEDILYISMDGLVGLPEAIETVFPNSQTQRCVVHLCRNLYKICNKKEVKDIIKDFKAIYTAPNLEIANAELDNFKNKYAKKELIVNKVIEYMKYLYPLFELPAEIRKVIYTTNTIESVNSALRKVTRGKGAFPNNESLMKVLYLRIKDLEKKWEKPINGWKTILEQLIQIHGERVTKYIEL